MNGRILLNLGACLLLSVAASSCIRSSTVVKIRKDGSGEIISRYYFSPRVLALVEQFGGAGNESAVPGVQAAPGLPDFGMIGEIVSPERESLENDASNYGKGVSYRKHESGKDADGWKGYSVIYAFTDVNQLRIDQSSVPGKAREFVESSGQLIDGNKGGSLTFDLDGDLLTIHSILAEESFEGMIDREQLERAREMGMRPSEALELAAASTRGMRAGFFVRIEPDIAETNAEHVTGNLIILSEADVSGVLQDSDFASFVGRMTEDPDSVTRESVKDLFREIEAMTIELSDSVTVRFP